MSVTVSDDGGGDAISGGGGVDTVASCGDGVEAFSFGNDTGGDNGTVGSAGDATAAGAMVAVGNLDVTLSRCFLKCILLNSTFSFGGEGSSGTLEVSVKSALIFDRLSEVWICRVEEF